MKHIAHTLLLFSLIATIISGCTDKTSTTTSPSSDANGGSVFAKVDADGGYVPGSFIVILSSELQNNQELAATKLDAIISDLSRKYEITVTAKWSAALLGFAAKMGDETAALLAKDSRIEMMERDRYSQAYAQTIPTGINRIEADASSTLSGNGSGTVSGVDIYIIDTGIMTNHADLNVVGGVNYVTGSSSYADQNGHGTHVAGTAAAKDNTINVVGVAPGATLYAVRVLNSSGSGQNSWIISGINWVTARKTSNPSRPMVANMSLGGYTGSTTYQAMDIAVRNSVTAGVVYTIAAGNSSADASKYSPAHVTEAITVGAYDPSNNRWASYSNYGTIVDILAPGSNIISTYYNGGTTTMSGTSMAAPHVAGTAALYLSNNTSATPAAVRAALLAAAAAPTKAANPAITRVPSRTTTTSVYAGNF
jgi:subtilisin family serine protease